MHKQRLLGKTSAEIGGVGVAGAASDNARKETFFSSADVFPYDQAPTSRIF